MLKQKFINDAKYFTLIEILYMRKAVMWGYVGIHGFFIVDVSSVQCYSILLLLLLLMSIMTGTLMPCHYAEYNTEYWHGVVVVGGRLWLWKGCTFSGFETIVLIKSLFLYAAALNMLPFLYHRCWLWLGYNDDNNNNAVLSIECYPISTAA